jgi:hypothetical protein
MRTKAKIVSAIFIILIMIVIPVIYHYVYWSYQRYAVVRIIERNRFPNSVVIDEQVGINWGMTSNWWWVTALVTFQSDSTFEEVKAWYADHPEGIRFEGDRRLDLLINSQNSDNNLITYRVIYQKWIEAFICPETHEAR